MHAAHGPEPPVPEHHCQPSVKTVRSGSISGSSAEAEKQVLKATKEGRSNPVVSVKSKQSKRKAGMTAAEVYEEAFGRRSIKRLRNLREVTKLLTKIGVSGKSI